MKQRCILKAPAKINLHLQIARIRQDGFHDIKSLFVMVDLYDQITISSLKTGNRCEINGSFDCAIEDNLIFRAWKIFCENTGTEHGVVFDIKKMIPSCAGMGGGSSDAACVLTGLNLLFETGFTVNQLCSMGEKLGSDIPFFLTGPAAVVKGRGEDVSEILNPRVLHFVVINPEIRVSTPEAYSWVDQSAEDETVFLDDEQMSRIYNADLEQFAGFQNDFAPVLAGRYPVFGRVIDELEAAGAVYSNVTGSGSVVFGLFTGRKSAGKAYETLKTKYKYVQKIKSLDRIPYAILE
ncbi:MAG: 4-(cytidine 5'-diphospho)-2-C-methyl-D-erythritol kinase [Spirochaetales bacterium]|nr:4-(cytidine 5'-diphospho)-2-C-methyl-D-erythritol kinase [Spirochaetales bacterium]